MGAGGKNSKEPGAAPPLIAAPPQVPNESENPMILGVDTGGTFTDFVLFDGQRLRVHKRLSTPEAPERAILLGIEEMGLDPGGLTLVHGSTVATNAALEGKGVKTLFITNRGFGDMLTIGRQARPHLYRLQQTPPAPPVPEALCLETGGRLDAGGETIDPLTDFDLDQIRRQIAGHAPEAVAINLLFSFLDDAHERAIEAMVPEGIFVSRSSAILPEYKEYERGIATWLNAWVGPLVERYLARLQKGLPQSAIAVMQSSGGTVAARHAGALAVHMLLSGPAGGLAGARRIGQLAGRERLLTFDMGGTSTDVALIDGEPRLTSEGRIGPYPVAVPMVDMHTIGAGGGSIAYLDEGGMLRVGPRSAGAAPGPACYGRGGREPTVTDANLVLGRLRPDAFLGGRMSLDVEAARLALERVATPLGLTPEAAAEGIVRIANEHMAQALRVISVQRGEDPRHYTLMPFGGAGGLHVCALADALGMDRILVPGHGGVLSAFGMLAGRRSRELSRTVAMAEDSLEEAVLEARFEALERQAREALEEEGVAASECQSLRSLDLRYQGQSFTLNVPWEGGLEATLDAFHRLHKKRYGHRLSRPLEIVNARVRMRGPEPRIELPEAPSGEPGRGERITLHGIGEARLYARATLARGQCIEGPALVTEEVATTFIEPGWRGEVDRFGNLLLERVATPPR